MVYFDDRATSAQRKITQYQERWEYRSNGCHPTFAFGVFAYQNPPNVTDNKVEFTNFQLKDSDKSKYLRIEVQNQGDGIAYCTSYIDLTNLDTGDQQRLKVKNFTIVPELIRDFNFFSPQTCPRENT